MIRFKCEKQLCGIHAARIKVNYSPRMAYIAKHARESTNNVCVCAGECEIAGTHSYFEEGMVLSESSK